VSDPRDGASPALRISYDPDVDALYLRLAPGPVAETVEIEESVYVDLGADGSPIGVEFVSGADFLPFVTRRGGEFVLPARMDEPATEPVATASD